MRLPGLIVPTRIRLLCVAALCTLVGCRSDAPYVVSETPMPVNTVMLAQMMRELSGRPGFTEAMLSQLNQGAKKGPAFLTPALIDRLRSLIVGKDWQGLDRFPGWTMREVNPTVRVVGHVVGEDQKVENLAARHPGTPANAEQVKTFIDLGPYTLSKTETINLDTPSTLPPFTTAGLVSELGAGVVRGDSANAQLAPLHPESQRLADVLNRLSLNGTNGVEPFHVARLEGYKLNQSLGPNTVFKLIAFYSSPESLITALQATGHIVTVSDARYFANFGHFHYKGQDVMMPFWVNSQIQVPGTNRPLLVPVSHAEYEWEIRGPRINANVSWYFGIDGKAEFRVMDTQDQPWVMGRHAHEYKGEQALEVTRLVTSMTIAYLHQHIARPALPFGGYYALGVCQDSVAAIEKKMTGNATLFPNTADASLFNDPRDAEVNELIAAIPKDRAGALPGPERIFGSLPTEDLAAISIPGLSADLVATRQALQQGKLKRTHGPSFKTRVALEALGSLLALLVITWLLRSRSRAT